MYLSLLILSSLLILHAFALHHHGQPGRRACGTGSLNEVPVVLHTESFVQPIHKPYITHCQGHRLCSTYRTLYRVAYRSVSRLAPVAHSYPECCPGWRRFHSHTCNQAVCAEACANGGTCFRPNQCACVSGWTGGSCQTDVDECSSSKPCSQTCINTAGSYVCGCRAGYTLAEDGHSCQTLPASSLPDDRQPSSSSNSTGVSNTPKATLLPELFSCCAALHWTEEDVTISHFTVHYYFWYALGLSNSYRPDADTVNNMTKEVQLLKNKVELLEEKLHQALAPFTSLFPLSLEQSVAERTSFLTQSFQQLERIDSLSEQIGFLEERLETCSCQDN